MKKNRTNTALTPKQEKFCLVYLETGNASEAYRQVYDVSKMKPVTVNRTAKALLDNHKIATRLEELKKPVREAAQITLQSHLEDLLKLRNEAVKANQFSAAISAEQLRGKAAGLYIEKKDVTGSIEILWGED